MLEVTARAMTKLEEALQQQRPQPELMIRVIVSPAGDQLLLAWDEEKEGDRVVESDSGTKLLLIGPDMEAKLETVVIDYEETPQGAGFTVSGLVPQPTSSKVVEVTDATFDEEVLRSDLPTEVDFWAPWCGPCRMVGPVYDRLSEEYDGRFKFCKVNVDENPQTAMRYQVMSIPTQLFFKDGQVVDTMVGAAPEAQIRSRVEALL